MLSQKYFHADFKKDLEKDIASDTSGDFRRLLIAQVNGNRADEKTPIDPSIAMQEAHELHKVSLDSSAYLLYRSMYRYKCWNIGLIDCIYKIS